MLTGFRRILVMGAVIGAGPVDLTRGAADPAALIREIGERSATLGAPLAVSNLNLKTQAASFEFDEGLLFPASPVGGQTVEMVFVGRGRMRFETTSPVEMDHLELHSGQRRLSTHFTEAVFVVAAPEMRELLLGSATAPGPAGARGMYAMERYQNWLRSGERRLMGVDAALFRAAVGELEADRFLAAWLGGTDWGDLWYSENPDDDEPIALGRLRKWRENDEERRERERDLEREQRKGRNQALRPEDEGRLEEWVSTTVDGQRVTRDVGDSAFDPEHYRIDVSIDDKVLRLAGTAELRLRSRQEGRRTLRLSLGDDFKVEAVEDAGGSPLPWLQTRGTIMVLLPEPVSLGSEVGLRVRYSGSPFDRAKRGTYSMRDTTGWHPRAGELDHATFDVTIRWPWSLSLAAAGTRVDGGRGEGTQWERRRLDFPADAFGFELGSFEYRQVQAGHVRLTFAYGRGEDSALTYRQEGMEAEVVDILSFYEETFGRLPIDEFTFATLPRGYAQGLFGFVTFASGMMDERSQWQESWRAPDRRSYLAHELAHQWWGNLVGWRSYRDQWLSEALAEYSAMLYLRRRLDEAHRYKAGRLGLWNQKLLAWTGERYVESIGPVVLGRRLQSYKGIDAYRPIVYLKGGLIMDMLGRRFMDESAFPTMLSHIVRVARSRPLSTEQFLSSLERMSGANLETFAQQFIYGTGLPYIVYEYTITPARDGAKAVTKGEARIFAPPIHAVRVEPVEGGRFDLRHLPTPQGSRDGFGLVIPFQLDLPKGYMHGRLPLRGPVTPFQLESDQTPERFWLDVRGEILARSISTQIRPKTARLYLGRLLRSEGDDLEAEKTLLAARRETDLRDPTPGREDDAIADDMPGQVDRDGLSEQEHAQVLRDIDLEIMTELAELYLDTGRPAEAKAMLQEMETLMGRRMGLGLEATRKDSIWELEDGGGAVNRLTAHLQARLELLEGRPAELLKTFKKAVGTWRHFATGENYAMLAIAAHQTGDPKAFRDYREKARVRGVDMTALTAAPVPAAGIDAAPREGAP